MAAIFMASNNPLILVCGMLVNDFYAEPAHALWAETRQAVLGSLLRKTGNLAELLQKLQDDFSSV